MLTAAQYNQLFTMHGTTMVFLVGMPLAVAFGNYFVPLMIGARDVAFPRLNMFGYWIFLFGGLFMYSSFLLGGAPNGGWFGYTPLTSTPMSQRLPARARPRLLGRRHRSCSASGRRRPRSTSSSRSSTCARPGMTLMRMPVFVWMMLVVAFLTLFAMPIVTAALIMVFFDRNFDTNFFTPSAGGDPLLYQHLFWIFGHPEVYILILPGMGIVSEILPGVLAQAAVRLLGRRVLRHRDRVPRLGRVGAPHVRRRASARSRSPRSASSTMLIAIPTGVKIFNWLGTVWGGAVRLTTPMLFALGLHRACSRSAACRACCTRSCRPTRSRPTPTSSSRTSTTCCSAA